MPLTLLYFGSFNPVHKGHIAIAEAAIDQHIADEVWFVLSPRNPFKQAENLWDESERAARLQKALQPHPGFKFCDAELHLPKPSYKINQHTVFKLTIKINYSMTKRLISYDLITQIGAFIKLHDKFIFVFI